MTLSFHTVGDHFHKKKLHYFSYSHSINFARQYSSFDNIHPTAWHTAIFKRKLVKYEFACICSWAHRLIKLENHVKAKQCTNYRVQNPVVKEWNSVLNIWVTDCPVRVLKTYINHIPVVTLKKKKVSSTSNVDPNMGLDSQPRDQDLSWDQKPDT